MERLSAGMTDRVWNSDEIIHAIDSKVSIPRVWTIGITSDPKQRKLEQPDSERLGWEAWRADSEEIARDIEKHYLRKGMRGDPGGGDSPTYVYVSLGYLR